MNYAVPADQVRQAVPCTIKADFGYRIRTVKSHRAGDYARDFEATL